MYDLKAKDVPNVAWFWITNKSQSKECDDKL